jgi:hypothetical protein
MNDGRLALGIDISLMPATPQPNTGRQVHHLPETAGVTQLPD